MEQGIVVETRDNKILVETGASSGCGGCSASRTCLIGADGAKRRLWMDNDGARVGDEVTFEIAGRAVVLGTAVMYLLPVILLFTGIIAGASIGEGIGAELDISSITGGAAGLLISALFAWVASRAMNRKRIALPRLIDITHKGKTINCR